MLDEFGLLDEVYGRGYNEENDLILRANRCGYQAALANHAFVYHIGEMSFNASDSPKQELEAKNSGILIERYPEYPRSITKYFNGIHYQAECMLTALLPDQDGRLDLVFDFSSVGTYHNGTFAAAKRVLEAALETWQHHFRIYVMVSEDAQKFHKLDRMKGLLLVRPETTRTFAIAFRFGQPFDYERLERMSRVGVLNVYMMLDTIAMDCLYLHQLNLDALWGTVFNYADAVLYNSRFVQEQFSRRFRRRPGLKEMPALHSLEVSDYRESVKDGEPTTGSYILVIGNAFAHKYVVPTIDALTKAFPREKIVALGQKEDRWHNVTSYPSGNLTDAQMQNLMRGAKVVVFPSHAEGFGIPVVESLAYAKPVLARSIPVVRELREHLPEKDNLILYESTQELISLLTAGYPQWRQAGESGHPVSWKSGTAEIGDFLWRLIGNWSFRDHLIPRLAFMRILAGQRKELDGPAPSATPGANDTDPESVKELKARLRDKEARVKDLENSLSWKITAPVRAVASVVFRLMGRGPNV
jgi:glycosyltransferase involved in cell wall biosynthesis